MSLSIYLKLPLNKTKDRNVFLCAMTYPIIMESYCTSPETEEKKKREKEREDMQLISCEYFSMTNRKNGSFKRFLSQPLNL